MPGPLDALGWAEPWIGRLAALGHDGAVPGRVTRGDRGAVLVVTADGARPTTVLAAVRPRPVVGDWVAVAGGVVVATLPRSSLLRRQDPSGGEQALVANVDVVLVVCGLDRPVKPGRIQRTAALALDAGATPMVVLTKADLVADPAAARAQVERANPGMAVLVVSATSGDGLEELRALTGGGTVALLGESGAGKSTLANALVGATVAATGAIRAGDARGRHTTTARQLHTLPGGGVLVDTPGIRSVGLRVASGAVAATFDDITALAAGCRFADCAHHREPGCEVLAAVERGTLAASRLAAWAALEQEAADAGRADDQARRALARRLGRRAREAVGRRGEDQ